MKVFLLIFIFIESCTAVGDFPTIWKRYHPSGTLFTVDFELFCPHLENRITYNFQVDLCEFDVMQRPDFVEKVTGIGLVGGIINGTVKGRQFGDQVFFNNGWDIMINVHHDCTFDGKMTCINLSCPDNCWYDHAECYCKMTSPLMPLSHVASCFYDQLCDW